MCDMASSKVMSTTSPTNPDLPLQPSLCSSLSTLLADLQQHNSNNININNLNGGGGGDQSQNLGSMSMEDLLKNMYSAPPGPPEVEAVAHAPMFEGASISREGSFSLPKEIGNKSVDEVWKEIVAGGSDQRPGGAGEGEGGDGGIEGMTLEDFLTKAGAVREEDVRGSDQVVTGAVGYGVEAVVDGQYQVGFVNHNNGGGGGGRVVGLGGGGRGKRRAVEEPVLDKATQQKQRRMIKNRESAARSRERKQAYTVELESLVTQLEQENARLVREEAEQNKERFKQLMENLIPVVEKQRTPRVLRRVQSLPW